MKKRLICIAFSLFTSATFADNIPQSFDNRPVVPTLKHMAQSDWQWQNFAALPNTTPLEKDSEHTSYQSLTQTISEKNPYTYITFYGSKTQPEVAVIESRTWGAANTQQTDFVKLEKLKGNQPLKSNCNLKNVSTSETNKDDEGHRYETSADLDFQQIYLLSKQIGQRDLYAVSAQVKSYVITGSFQTQAYTQTIITPHKAKLAQYIHQFGWHTDAKGKQIQCVIH